MAAWREWNEKDWDSGASRDWRQGKNCHWDGGWSYSEGYNDGFVSGWRAGWDEATKQLVPTAVAAVAAAGADRDAKPTRPKRNPGYVAQWFKDWYATGCADLDKFPRWEFWDDQAWQPYKENMQEKLRESLTEAADYALPEIHEEMDVDGWEYEIKLFLGPEATKALSRVKGKFSGKICIEDIVGVQKNLATGKERPVRVVDH